MEHTMRVKGCWPAVAPLGDPLTLLGGGAGPTVISALGGAAGTSVSPAAGMAAELGGEIVATVGGGQTTPSPAEEAKPVQMEQQAKSLIVLNYKSHHMATFRLHPTTRLAWEAWRRRFAPADRRV